MAEELKRVTGDEGVSVNQFINIAVAEKLAVLRTTDFFAERIKCANPDDMLSILELAGTDEVEIECHDLIEPDLSKES